MTMAQSPLTDSDQLDSIVQKALDEDVGFGDITTAAVLEGNPPVNGHFLAKEDLVLAGWSAVVRVFHSLSNQVSLELLHAEGSLIPQGTTVGKIQGPSRSLLAGERVALNFLQRLSGIATLTRKFVEKVAGTGTEILDTRKTTPGLRILEKEAVRIGGGKNHRFGLYDGILIKDNHIVAAGGIRNAVSRARTYMRHLNKIEVEVKDLGELEEALEAGVEAVLLDNMSVNQVREAVQKTAGRAFLEVSGGVNLQNVRDYALTGVNFISVGALTHSAKAVDISLELRLVQLPH
jgi:nicotinate-nucleotide pyrophosphorylase (carboxylating)